MSKQRSYSDETKAAVMAALLEGQSVSSVAREYKIPKGTVSGWKKKAKGEGVEANTTQKKQVGDLLVGVLQQNLKTLDFLSETLRDPEWIKKQDAASLATLYGVMTDKAVRVIEAFGEASE